MIDGIYSCWGCKFSIFHRIPDWDWKCIHPKGKKLFTNDDPEENFRVCPYRELEKLEGNENDQN